MSNIKIPVINNKKEYIVDLSIYCDIEGQLEAVPMDVKTNKLIGEPIYFDEAGELEDMLTACRYDDFKYWLDDNVEWDYITVSLESNDNDKC
tara:strand:+ start:1082 stop:1357 length:276 start_codon:yes stop_codon:yes gene_type:complete